MFSIIINLIVYIWYSHLREFRVLSNERKRRFFELFYFILLFLFFSMAGICKFGEKFLSIFNVWHRVSCLSSEFSIVSRRHVKWKSWERRRNRNFCRVEIFTFAFCANWPTGYDFQVCFSLSVLPNFIHSRKRSVVKIFFFFPKGKEKVICRFHKNFPLENYKQILLRVYVQLRLKVIA